MAKRTNERDSACKIFDICCSGASGDEEFENRRQIDDEFIDKFLDELELLRRSYPDEIILEKHFVKSRNSWMG